MKIKAKNTFYATETGIIKSGMLFETPEETAWRLVGGGLAEYVREPEPAVKHTEPAPKKTTRTKKA